MQSIGIDIGGTSIRLGVLDLAGNRLLHEHSIPTPKLGAKEMAGAIVTEVRQILHEYPEIRNIGVGVPGMMNRERTLVQYPPNLLGWKEEPLKKYFEELLPECTISVDNDAKVAMLAEAYAGAAAGEPNFFMATLGTGVGGGIFSDGKIFRGAEGGAGEFGHVSIDYNGPRCGCGSRGCIEAYLGQRYLSERTLLRLASSDEPSSLRGFLDKGELEPRDISLAAGAGDKFAIGVLVEAGILLGIALANVAKLLDLRIFVVGGGIAEAGPLILKPAETALIENAMPNQRSNLRLVKAMHGTRAGMIGAAILATI